MVSIVIIVILLAIAIYWWSSRSREDFWDIPSRTWKVERVLKDTSCPVDFLQTPAYQGILNPRFSNVDYGANIRTQIPYYNKTGVPADPLGGDVGGSFSADQSGCVQDVRKTQFTQPVSACSPCSNIVQLDPHNPSAYTTTGTLPSKVQSGGVEEGFESYLTPDGELKQPIVYDRYLYANRQSRLRAQGDPVRGDLPIVPITGNWFVPNVHPNIDLQAGAMNVLGGVNNETNHQLANLIYHSSGGGDTTIGGVDMTRMNMANQIFGATSAARGDVIMTSYP